MQLWQYSWLHPSSVVRWTMQLFKQIGHGKLCVERSASKRTTAWDGGAAKNELDFDMMSAPTFGLDASGGVTNGLPTVRVSSSEDQTERREELVQPQNNRPVRAPENSNFFCARQALVTATSKARRP
jgi:hypothetical protein